MAEIPTKIKKALTFQQAQNIANEIIKKEGGYPIDGNSNTYKSQRF